MSAWALSGLLLGVGLVLEFIAGCIFGLVLGRRRQELERSTAPMSQVPLAATYDLSGIAAYGARLTVKKIDAA